MLYVERSPANADIKKALSDVGSPGDKERILAREYYINKKGNAPEFKAYKADAVKKELEKLFHGKCAYCESKYQHVQSADIEHFRPKNSLGYWWLAASWENLLPSCISCNRAGKRDRFPLLDELTRLKPEAVDPSPERPILIDPTREQPSDFIKFEARPEKDRQLAIACPVSSPQDNHTRGSETIDILGLNRMALVEARTQQLSHVRAAIDRMYTLGILLQHSKDEPKSVPIIAGLIADEMTLLKELFSRQSSYTAMVRQIATPLLAPFGLTVPEE